MSDKRIQEGFLQTNVDLGHIFAGKNYDVKFPHRDVTKIDKVEASCDCVQIDNDIKYGRLLVKFKPKFPKHLEERGDKQYDTQKSIQVHYYTKSKPDLKQFILLLFTAKVMKQ